MTLDTLILKRTLNSESLKQLSRSYIAEKPEKVNIQGVEIHLVKQNKNGQITDSLEGGCNLYGGRRHLDNRPREGLC